MKKNKSLLEQYKELVRRTFSTKEQNLIEMFRQENVKISFPVNLNTTHSWSANGKPRVILPEGIAPEENQWARRKGGTIVFSTDVNAINKKLEFDVLRWFKDKYETILNRSNQTKKIKKIIDADKEVRGYTIGNFFKGRYIADNGKRYDENSTSINIINVDSETLIRVATELCRSFNQESVILKDDNLGEYIVIDQS